MAKVVAASNDGQLAPLQQALDVATSSLLRAQEKATNLQMLVDETNNTRADVDLTNDAVALQDEVNKLEWAMDAMNAIYTK